MAFVGFGGFNRANQAAILQQQQSDMLQAQNIFTQMGAEARKSQMQRWQINSELQTKIHEITAKVTVNKAKMADKAMNAMDDALSLNALSFDLDMAMAQYLQSHFPGEPINRNNYALAYRNVGRIEDRKHQIDIISHLGDQLADVIKIRGIGMLISLSRRPAKLAGLLALHEFLERGFDAFKAIGDVQSFIDPVLVREKAIMQLLLSDDLTLPEDNPLPVV